MLATIGPGWLVALWPMFRATQLMPSPALAYETGMRPIGAPDKLHCDAPPPPAAEAEPNPADMVIAATAQPMMRFFISSLPPYRRSVRCDDCFSGYPEDQYPHSISRLGTESLTIHTTKP